MQVVVGGGGVGQPAGQTARWFHAVAESDATLPQRHLLGVSARQLWPTQQAQNFRWVDRRVAGGQYDDRSTVVGMEDMIRR